MAKNDLDKLVKPDDNPDPTAIGYGEMHKVEDDFQLKLREDPKYSLEVDPTGRYNFTDEEIDFVNYMIQYKNVQFVTTVLMNIPLEKGVELYKRYDILSEIKRINLAMYARRFATKMADLDQIGGFLTSGLIDDNVPIAERWGAKEKITASKLLINLNMLKVKALNKPEVVDVIEVQKDLDKLTPKELENLIEMNDEGNEDKEKLISIINEDNMLSMEELKNLRTMTIEELQDLVNTITEGELDEDEED